MPASCFIFHAVYNLFILERPGNLLWMCHVTTLLLAVGLIGSMASVIRLVTPWTILGLPIWLVDALSVGTTRIAVLSHVVVPMTAVVALSQVGAARSAWRATGAAMAFHVGLQLLCHVATRPKLNVNLSHKIYPFFGSAVVNSYALYWTITAVVLTACLYGLHVTFKRRFPPLSLDDLLDSRALAATASPAAVGASAAPVGATDAPVETSGFRKRPATSASMLRGKPAAALVREVLDDDAPLAPKPTEPSEPSEPPTPGPVRGDWIPPKLRARGFTLLEMMVVVSVLGLLAAIAVPDLTPAIHNARLRASVDEVRNFAERARRNARAEGRCYRVRVEGDSALVMDRRTHADCFTDALLDTGWSEVMRAQVMGPGFKYFMETVPADAPPAARAIIFRPNGRLRGDGDLDVEDDGGRIYIESEQMGNVGMDVVITSFGRICGRRVPSRPSTLTAPVVCGFGFLAGGTALDGGSVPAPPPAPAPAPGPAPAPAPAPAPGPAPAPAPGPAPAPAPGPAPAPAPGPAPAPAPGPAPAPAPAPAPPPAPPPEPPPDDGDDGDGGGFGFGGGSCG